MFTATYSPDDNRLFLSASSRLDAETYARVKEAGFRWAPKQDLFIAPAWSPQREDLAIELAGQIDDEDSTLMGRAEDRAERFEGYQERRRAEAERAREAVSAIADNIPLGQPILVGHHSERHARRDVEKIKNGMNRAVKLWKTSEYWKDRAASAIAHARYKELPAVRHRRIKTLEAERRKWLRERDDASLFIRLWSDLDNPELIKRAGEPVSKHERALYIANRDHCSRCYTLAEFPRNPPVSQYEGPIALWSALGGGKGEELAIISADWARGYAIAQHERCIVVCDRWIEHLDNRLTYERAMLGEAGGYQTPAKPKSKAALPILNYGGVVAYRNAYSGETIEGEAVGLTKEQWAAIPSDYKGTRVSADGTHRVRSTMAAPGRRSALVTVYLTDSKTHPRPTESQVAATAEEEAAERLAVAQARAARQAERAVVKAAEPDPATEAFEAPEKAARAGVQVVVADQLFPTPPAIARRMVALAGTMAGCRVLEPSAGTGNLIEAIVASATGFDCVNVVAVEINGRLCEALRHRRTQSLHARPSNFQIHGRDFLAYTKELGAFDRVIMNPPFADGADIKHILAAKDLLKPGGVLVALCANGPRQRAALQPLADHWEDLPAGSFKAAGTGVNVALLRIRAPEGSPTEPLDSAEAQC